MISFFESLINSSFLLFARFRLVPMPLILFYFFGSTPSNFLTNFLNVDRKPSVSQFFPFIFRIGFVFPRFSDLFLVSVSCPPVFSIFSFLTKSSKVQSKAFFLFVPHVDLFFPIPGHCFRRGWAN